MTWKNYKEEVHVYYLFLSKTCYQNLQIYASSFRFNYWWTSVIRANSCDSPRYLSYYGIRSLREWCTGDCWVDKCTRDLFYRCCWSIKWIHVYLHTYLDSLNLSKWNIIVVYTLYRICLDILYSSIEYFLKLLWESLLYIVG